MGDIMQECPYEALVKRLFSFLKKPREASKHFDVWVLEYHKILQTLSIEKATKFVDDLIYGRVGAGKGFLPFLPELTTLVNAYSNVKTEQEIKAEKAAQREIRAKKIAEEQEKKHLQDEEFRKKLEEEEKAVLLESFVRKETFLERLKNGIYEQNAYFKPIYTQHLGHVFMPRRHDVLVPIIDDDELLNL